MTSLRMRVVEAGARAWVEDVEGDSWEDMSLDKRIALMQVVDVELGAMLDVLAENADEWADYPAEADPIVVAHREIIARKLLAVLREDR